MARFTTAGGSGDGTPGAPGADGADGEDGAPGERGTSSLSWTYKIDVTNSLDRDPGNDYIGFATLPFTSSAKILVDDNPFGINTTLHDLFLGIQNGYLTLTSQTDPSAYATYQITSSVAGTATNETSTGSYVVFNVSSYTGYGSFIHDELVTLSISIAGPQGEPGADGADGADAIWNFTGEYNGGSSYAVGDLATYGGQLWYRTHANGGTVGNTPSEGFIWALLAAKGADGSGGTADTGDITFDGIQIIGAGTASGDGNDLGTIELVPDGDITSDQYVIIDPTSPNHIHLRAGGVQDNSSAHIFLGGERNNIEVSDPYRTVKISTKPDGTENTYGNSNEASNTEFVHASSADIQSGDTVRLYTGGPTYVVDNVTQDYPYAGAITVTAPGLSFITGEAYVFTRDQGYNNQWTFGNDGVLSGPAEGGLSVRALFGNSEDTLVIANSTKLILDGGLGEFLNDESANNQIATIGDLPTTANDSWTVAIGTATYSFTLPSSGTYVMWVEGNIPNGIISWNATVSVTNTNVPAIGSQYAWNYTSGGSPILLTAIPNQIRGVAGTINTDATYLGNTSNKFDFTIANTSGASRTVYYGYTKI